MVSSKQELRQRLRSVRDRIAPARREELARSAATRAFAKLSSRQVITVYSAIRSELDPRFLVDALRARGATIAYPRIHASSPVLEFVAVASDAELQTGPMGILEPASGASPIALSDIDAFVIPALSFDPNGNRLGWGKGHYDQTLAQNSRALRVGICFQEQIEPSLPCEPTDQVMDWVVTDTKVYQGRVRQPAGPSTHDPKVQK